MIFFEMIPEYCVSLIYKNVLGTILAGSDGNMENKGLFTSRLLTLGVGRFNICTNYFHL